MTLADRIAGVLALQSPMTTEQLARAVRCRTTEAREALKGDVRFGMDISAGNLRWFLRSAPSVRDARPDPKLQPGSQNARILAALADGGWHTTASLYARVGGCILHSRIAELRSRGYHIESEHVPGESGARGHRYRLISGPARDTAEDSSPAATVSDAAAVGVPGPEPLFEPPVVNAALTVGQPGSPPGSAPPVLSETVGSKLLFQDATANAAEHVRASQVAVEQSCGEPGPSESRQAADLATEVPQPSPHGDTSAPAGAVTPSPVGERSRSGRVSGAEPLLHDIDGLDPRDQKSPGFHSRLSDAWDLREKGAA